VSPRLGVALMSAAMLLVPTVDGLAKHLSAAHSPLFIGWARYAVACLAVIPFAALRFGARIFPAERLGAHALRTALLVLAMTLYFVAVARIPMVQATIAFFVAPILAVVLSVFLLKENLTLRKVASLVLGFLGSLVILRPGGSIEPGLLFAFGSGSCFALYMIATRLASKDSDPLKTLAFQCVFGALLLTPQAAYAWSTPRRAELVFFAGLGLFSALSHMLSIAAFRVADASTLAPLVYLELVGSAAIGYLAFGDVPGLTTWAGAALIVWGGLLLARARG
jgi:drug/metabolite transporter (DMT)-like permease